ncbi:MAG: hypothetical protein L3J39_07415 [Verrucomicrobiales bacterium]|nr:hypothetical protein [Verrucomicrobiales bacterium]
MKTHIKILTAAAVLALSGAAPSFAGEKGVVVPEAKKETSVFSTFIKDSRPFVNGRLRYGWAGIDGSDDSYLLSLRNRFGIETGKLAGFSFLVEGEHTWLLTDTDKVNTFPGTGSKQSIIADPENLQLNRLQMAYDGFDSHLVAGRQKITIDDHRFIGDIGWRQNDQTFDAALFQNQSIENLKLTYAYINRVNRIFGEMAPNDGLTRFDSDSHLFHLEYDAQNIGKIRAFSYLLDFGNESALANKWSTNTYGLELQGAKELGASKINFTYLATAAFQESAGANTSNSNTAYYRAELGLKKDKLNGGIGAEFLTSDSGQAAFQTPLSTAHKFNGFADAFLITPDTGLRDYYIWLGATCPLEIKHKLILHYFTSDYGSDALGFEADYVAVRKINDHFTALLKLAFLNGRGSQPDISRVTLQMDYSF